MRSRRFAFLFLPLLASAQLKPELAIRTRSISELEFSPDGKRLAFTLREPPSGRTQASHIWVYDRDSNELRQWTHSPKTESSPHWSPDGRMLAFRSDREEGSQIWLLSTQGGEAWKLTKAKNSVRAFRWSPDGSRIAFIANDPKSDAEEKKEKDFDDARVIDRDDKPARLWTVDVASGAVRAETKDPWAVRDFDWLPGGKRVLIVATDQPAVEKYTERIFALALDTGAMSEVLAPRGPFGRIRVAPGGTKFAFIGSRVDGPSEHDLFVCPLDGKPVNVTGPTKDRPVSGFEWLSNGEPAVLFNEGFRSELANFPRIEGVDVISFAVSKTGTFAAVAGAASIPEELYVDGKRASHFNDEVAAAGLVKPEIIQYRSFDGTPIEAALFRPPGSEGKLLPLIVHVHGGPTGAWTNRFEPLTQMLVARGFAVLLPNIRGSSGYGHKFIEANRADWGGGDFKDVMAGVDEMIRRKVADPERLGIGGWSYGGYMSAWAVTQTNRFKAAVAGAGLSDLAAEFGTENGPMYDEWFFGVPYENLAVFQKCSPITYVKNAKTPTLILQGEADTTDPISQSQIFYRALKHYNVTSEFVVYPREPHGLREEKHILDRYRRTLDWFTKYVQ
jgi:dipeptidyl aminopeptidase/acylaminoacyl peptidase